MQKPILTAALAVLLTITGNFSTYAQNITVTISGQSIIGGSGGDGGFCTQSELYQPTDVCKDAIGNIYIADNGNRKIRMISEKTGIISTYAGGGLSISDGIPATDAELIPMYMCMDNTGNLYVTTTDNKVRMIAAGSGIITTVAGTGTSGYSGDGGQATDAQLNAPGGICIDGGGNLYVVDGGASTVSNLLFTYGPTPGATYIRKIAPSGIITTIAGTATPGYSGDGGPSTAAQINYSAAICVNSAGDIFFSDQPGIYSYGGAFIRKISAATGIITTIAGNGNYPADGNGGPASAACLGDIYGMCTDGAGDLYIDDVSCSCRKINMTTGIIDLVAGSMTVDGFNGDDSNSLNIELSYPAGLIKDPSGNILIADTHNQRVRKSIPLSHKPSFVYGHGIYFNGWSNLSNLLPVVDVDSGQLETWSIITPPQHGSVSGLPAVAMSGGVSYASRVLTSVTYGQNITYTGPDSFQVQVSDGALSDTVMIYVSDYGDSTARINTPSKQGLISIYPNPVSSIANIRLGGAMNSNVPLTITDVTGRELYRNDWVANKNTMQVDVSTLPQGVYFVSVNGVKAGKFVKE